MEIVKRMDRRRSLKIKSVMMLGGWRLVDQSAIMAAFEISYPSYGAGNQKPVDVRCTEVTTAACLKVRSGQVGGSQRLKDDLEGDARG
jgi:hypothetical protein